MPDLAVLIAVHNAQDALIRTLQSLDRQAGDFDIFVVDDGSAPPIAINGLDYGHTIRLTRLENNQGPFVAANKVLQQIMRGDYRFVARQDAGDLDVDNRLALQVAFLEAHPDVALVGAWVRFVNAAGSPLFLFKPPISTRGIRRRMRYGAAIIHPSSMIRIDALRKVGLYDDRYRVGKGFVGGDYDLFFRITQSLECANIPKFLVIKEEDRGISVSVDRRRQSASSRIKTLLRYFDWRSPHSYLGLLYCVILYITPYPLVMKIKILKGSIW